MKLSFLFVAILLSSVFMAVATPSISSPSNGVEIIKGKANVSFAFSGTTGASYVELWIDNNPGFGSPEVGFDNGQSSDYTGSDGITSIASGFSFTASLQNALPQNVYYAKAILLDANKKQIGSWSNVINFTLLDWHNPPTISSPANNQEFVIGAADISFSFSGTTGADKLELWIDNNSGFGSPEVGFDNGTATPWIKDGIFSVGGIISLTKPEQMELKQNVYNAKVRLISSGKMPISDWSSVVKFTLLTKTEERRCGINLIENQINAGYQQKTGTINFSLQTTLCPWSITANQSWIKITSPVSGTGNGVISYSVLENTSQSTRQGKITVTSDNDTKEIAVSQEATSGPVVIPADLMLVSSSFNAGSAGGDKQIMIKNDGDETLTWSVSGMPAWLTISSSGGTIAGGQLLSIYLSVSENTTQDLR